MANKPKTTASKKTVRASAGGSGGKNGNGTKKTVAAAAAAGATVAIARKLNAKTFVIALISFLAALAVGAVACFMLGKNDKFELKGSDELTLTLGEVYTDEGADIREFGLDFSDKAVVETNLKRDENGGYYADEVGTYYISYSVKSLKLGFVYKIKKVRLVTFVEESESGE